MLKVRDAKPLFVVSALLVPWDVFAFGGGLGWGVHFPLIRFVDLAEGTQYLTVFELFRVTNQLGQGTNYHIVLWMVAGVVTGLAALYTLLARVLSGTTRRREDRAVGAVLAVSGALFIVSRFLVHDYLLFGGPDDIYWLSVPFGAVYTIFVGAVFYFDKFQLGA